MDNVSKHFGVSVREIGGIMIANMRSSYFRMGVFCVKVFKSFDLQITTKEISYGNLTARH